MGPILICDKSSLQSLHPLELNALRRYYSLNIPPVLLVEILGNLKKADDITDCRSKVQQLARKLVPACSAVNAPFQELIVSEFHGQEIETDGRPLLTGGKSVKSPDGENGVIFDEAAEDQALLRWQAGEFSEAETVLAAAFRRASQSVDAEEMQRQLRKFYGQRLNLRTLDEAIQHVDDLMIAADPEVLLRWFLADIDLTPGHQREIIERLKMPSFRSLESSAPYTSHCLRAALLFHFSLAFGLVPTRRTNRVDLEYLYYVPFCDAFSSGDTFHRQTIRYFLKPQQEFIERDLLKADLRRLADWWSGLDEVRQAAESRRSGPPEGANSATHLLWQRLMKPGYRDRERLDATLPPEVLEKLCEQLCQTVGAAQLSGEPLKGSLEDFNFVARKHNVKLDGPCICGSDRKFRDCCGAKLPPADSPR